MSVELLALHHHLLVDAPQVLRAAGDLGHDAQLFQPAPHVFEHLREIQLALRRAVRHHVVDLGVALRMQRGEREVLELLLHVLHAEAVRQRRVDVDRLASDALLLARGQRGERRHVVEPVGQLDDEDAHVLRHRHEHLAHRGGLLRLLRVELDALELRDTVDDAGDVGAELRGDVLERDVRVFDRVVQEGGGDGDVVETEVGDDRGDRQRVMDVRLPRLAHLLAVSVSRQLVGPGDHQRARLRVVRPEGADERGDLFRRRDAVAPPRKHPGDGRHRLILRVDTAQS